MIYTDGIHLVADSLQELHKFAYEITLSKCWFHNRRGKFRPHYDIICPHMLERAFDRGAKLVDSKEIVKILKRNIEN